MSTAATDKAWESFRTHGLTAVIDRAVSSHARAVGLLVAVALLSFLPGFFQLPPIDRDEARFAQATKQMLETGEYVDIRFQDEVRYKKPVGIYWLQAATVKTAEALGATNARRTIWLYRIPSLVGAVGAVLLTYWTALAFVSRRAAVLAGLMMATCLLLGGEARLAKTDAMLLLTVVAAMGAMARVYLGERRPGSGLVVPAIFWTALAAGILIKGPLIILFVGLCALSLVLLDRSVRWVGALRPVLGLFWLAILVLPWFLAIVSRSGSSFFAESVGHDLLAKVISVQEAHGAPPGTYFALFWVTFWPGSTLTLMSVPSIWNARREKGAKFLLAWIVPAWIVLELVITKLPHYVLPLYPAIAILLSGVVDPHILARQRWLVRGTNWWFFCPAILGVGVLVAFVMFEHSLGLPAWPFIAAAIVFGLWAWRLYATDGAERSLLRAMIASILLAFGVYGLLLPKFSAAYPSRAIARILQRADCAPAQVATAGYEEPSLVFLVGTETKMVDGTDAAEFLRAGGCRFALVEARHERAFLRRADALGLRYAPPQHFEGYNYSIGRAVSISIYRAEGAP